MTVVPLWGQAALAAVLAAVAVLRLAGRAVALPASPKAADALLLGSGTDPRRWVSAVTTGGAVAAGLSWLLAVPPVRPLTAWTCTALVLLAATDVRTGRLPNRVVGGAAAGCVVLLAVAERADPAVGSVGSAVLAATSTFLGFATAAVLLPRSLGMGDAKLLGLVAFVVGYGGGTALVAFWAVLAVLSFVALLLVSRLLPAGRRLVPFGPLVCVAATAALWTA